MGWGCAGIFFCPHFSFSITLFEFPAMRTKSEKVLLFLPDYAHKHPHPYFPSLVLILIILFFPHLLLFVPGPAHWCHCVASLKPASLFFLCVSVFCVLCICLLCCCSCYGSHSNTQTEWRAVTPNCLSRLFFFSACLLFCCSYSCSCVLLYPPKRRTDAELLFCAVCVWKNITRIFVRLAHSGTRVMQTGVAWNRGHGAGPGSRWKIRNE